MNRIYEGCLCVVSICVVVISFHHHMYPSRCQGYLMPSVLATLGLGYVAPKDTLFLTGKLYVFVTRSGPTRPDLYPSVWVVRLVETTFQQPAA
jgi:hypothetical protein